MKKLLLFLAALSWASAQTPVPMARSSLYANINTLLPSGTGAITAANLRQAMLNIVASSTNPLTDGTPAFTPVPLTSLFQAGATTGQGIGWNGTTWVPTTFSGGGGGVTSVNTRTGAVTLTSADVALNNVTNVAQIPKTQVFPVATFQFDGGGATLTAGTTPPRPDPAAFTITGYTITSDVAGTVTMDVRVATGAGSFSTITGSATPALSSSAYLNSSTLTGWTTAIAAGTRLIGVITGTPATATQVTVTLFGTYN